MRTASRGAVVILLALTAACAATPVPPAAPAAPADAVALPPADPSSVTEEDLLDRATDPEALADLLDRAGFASATSRVWTGAVTDDVRRAEALAVRFDGAAGAGAYLGWVRAHPGDVVGAAEIVDEDPYLVVRHVPGGCCPNKDVRQVAAAWAAGPVVWVVTATGPGATPGVVEAIAGRIEANDGGSETDGA